MAATPITVKDVLDDAASMVGISTSSCDSLKPVVRTRLNAALQLIYLSPKGRDFFRETITIALVNGTVNYVLDTGIAEVLGPVRLASGCPLAPLGGRGEYDLYANIFEGNLTVGTNPGTPRAYYVEGARDSTAAPASGDSKIITLKIAPTPSADQNIEVEVRKEPSRYSAANFDLDASSSPKIPLPDAHCELILLPIVRHMMLSAGKFIGERERALMGVYAEAYQGALAAIGMTDPKRTTREYSNRRMEWSKSEREAQPA